MLNFTVGPVMSDPEVLEVSAQSAPYFRTPEFSQIMKENEERMLSLVHAPAGSRCVFLTSSGTGAMESVVMNVLKPGERTVVINGGSFGDRFAKLCRLHGHETAEVFPERFGAQIREEQLRPLAGQGYGALLVNMCETSSGILYDMPMLARFCRDNGMILIVDAISAFLADPLDMEELGAAVVLTGSQKALGVHPGVSVVALAPEALARAEANPEVCLYLSLKEALKNGERGQTPFTPAVATLLQIHKRLEKIEAAGGAGAERAAIAERAAQIREGIADLPFTEVAEDPSHCVTAVRPDHGGAKEIVRILKDEYQIWVCPNGGDLADQVFRIGHIGHITKEDNEALLSALHDMDRRGLL